MWSKLRTIFWYLQHLLLQIRLFLAFVLGILTVAQQLLFQCGVRPPPARRVHVRLSVTGRDALIVHEVKGGVSGTTRVQTCKIEIDDQ